MANTDVEKNSYGAFERFLFYTTPLIFLLVLLGVLFALLDSTVMNHVLAAANKVPFIERFVPDPKPVEKITLSSTAGSQQSAGETASETHLAAIEQLKSQLAGAQADLQSAVGLGQQKDETIKALEAKLIELEAQLVGKTQTDEEYRAQVQQLASIYAGMQASRAAPILEALSLQERVLVMSEMRPVDRGKLLEKMRPTLAAETSIQLKDAIPAKDMQLAALQSRLDLNRQREVQAASGITKDDLGQTFSQMTPKSAATVLIEMSGAGQQRVIDILKAMDNAGRAKVLSAIADTNKTLAAELGNKLAE